MDPSSPLLPKRKNLLLKNEGGKSLSDNALLFSLPGQLGQAVFFSYGEEGGGKRGKKKERTEWPKKKSFGRRDRRENFWSASRTSLFLSWALFLNTA